MGLNFPLPVRHSVQVCCESCDRIGVGVEDCTHDKKNMFFKWTREMV